MLAKLNVVILLVLLLNPFLVDLLIVVLAHLQPFLLLFLAASLILNLVLDQIIQGQDVPSVVGLGLDMACLASLHCRFGEIGQLAVHRLQLRVGRACRVRASVPDEVHRAVGDRRQNFATLLQV